MSTKLFFLFIVISYCPLVLSIPLEVSFTYQSWHNTPLQWFAMFTLCLAPLVTHVVFGLPKTVVFGEESPPWTEKITHLNPVSIVWRYYAITYRRLRATRWDAADMAACNAVFWDGKLWDGSEHVMIRSRDYLTNHPRSRHVAWVSGSALATIVLMLQGIQAIFYIIGNAIRTTIYFSDGLPGVFVPLGILGLLRLPAAYWITNDFGYTLNESRQPYVSFNRLTESQLRVWKSAVRRRLCDTRSWKCRCYRLWWLVTILVVMGFGIYDTLSFFHDPGAKKIFRSLSLLLFDLMYLQLAFGFLIIHPLYVFQRDHVSTVIPCIQSKWYKAYTWIMIVTAATTIIVQSLETLQLPDGSYTTHSFWNCSSVEGICTPPNKTAILESIESQVKIFLDEVI